jgi:thiamine biosynthesis lipoprotein
MTTYTDFIPATWHNHTFRAMGSEIAVWVETMDDAAATTALVQVKTLFARNEQALSRFRPDSELSRLNARCGHWVEVLPLLWDLLNQSLALAEQTNGYFDPTTLKALQQAGYVNSFNHTPPGSRPDRFLKPVRSVVPEVNGGGNWRDIQLDTRSRTVYLPPHLPIDLGGIAKGYTAQQAVELLQDVGPCLVDAGGDLVAGLAPTGYAGWPVAISSPWSDEAEPTDLFTLWLEEASLATSGIDYRRWVQEGRMAHHIINPFTHQPAATDALTVTILMRDAAAAEAWATATLITGSAGLDTLLAYEIPGLVITQEGSILATPVMHHHLTPITSLRSGIS